KELSIPQGSAEFPSRAHYYLLRNLSNGFEIRGRLSPNGRFENISLPPNTIHSVGYVDPDSGMVAAAVFETKNLGEVSRVPTAPFKADSGIDSDVDGLS